jgi:hypothetical protein
MLEVLWTVIAIVTYPDLQRRLTYQRFTMADAALCFLLQSFEATRQSHFCRGVHAIDKQDPLEVIVLMLNRPR